MGQTVLSSPVVQDERAGHDSFLRPLDKLLIIIFGCSLLLTGLGMRTLTKFLAGQPQEPTQVPAIRDWFDQVARMIREGRRMERVRVHVRTATGHAPVTAA